MATQSDSGEHRQLSNRQCAHVSASIPQPGSLQCTLRPSFQKGNNYLRTTDPGQPGVRNAPLGAKRLHLGLFARTPNIGGSENAALNPSAYQARSARDLACHSLAALQDFLCCACHYYFINERSQAAKHSRRIASPLRRIPDRRAKGPLLDFAWGISGRFNTKRFCVVHGPSRGRLLKHAHVVEGLDAWIERWVAPDNR
jgi:hypothetical protein